MSISNKAGTHIIVNLARMNLGEFDRPEKFDPSNHLNGRDEGTQGCPAAHGAKSKTFFPFGKGGRGCVGQNLAWLEMKALMRCFLQTYTVFDAQQAASPPDMANHSLLAELKTSWEIAQQPVAPVSVRLWPRCKAPLRILLCGPHASGKTTLLHALLPKYPACKGISEVARRVMKDGNIQRDQLEDPTVFNDLQESIFMSQREQEHALQERSFISDRSLIDPLAYKVWRMWDDDTKVAEVENKRALVCDEYLIKRALVFLVLPHGNDIMDVGIRLESATEEMKSLIEAFRFVLGLLEIPYHSIDEGSVDERVMNIEQFVARNAMRY
eukprot:gene20437-24484_t